MHHRIHIFAGHFGSGKTEVALNFAIQNAKKGKKVTIVDLDIVNPYFRTKDAETILKSYGIKVIASQFANSNLDMPTVPPEVLSVFAEQDSMAVFDVGGDDDGAFALGQYKRFFDKEEYCMHFVVNTKRPMTEKGHDLFEIFSAIEHASRLKFTDIANNTNLSDITDHTTLLSDYSEIVKLSELSGLPVLMQCGIPQALSGLPEDLSEYIFPMTTYLKKPWE